MSDAIRTIKPAGLYLHLSAIHVEQAAILRVDVAKCIRLTAEWFLSKVPLKVKVNRQGQLIEGYEEYVVAHTLGHTTIRVS